MERSVCHDSIQAYKDTVYEQKWRKKEDSKKKQKTTQTKTKERNKRQHHSFQYAKQK